MQPSDFTPGEKTFIVRCYADLDRPNSRFTPRVVGKRLGYNETETKALVEALHAKAVFETTLDKSEYWFSLPARDLAVTLSRKNERIGRGKTMLLGIGIFIAGALFGPTIQHVGEWLRDFIFPAK